ncbi:hypothetical protein AB0F93_00545 [Micromonospora tulbaghiae]|uniref:hypothetical protein n=1 Tax=Micromonospora tulbaghiae TaxID=479978 RepID=UPI00332BF498
MRRGQTKGAPTEPIARWVPDGDGEALLLDQVAVQIHFGVSERTVRRRCEPVACDIATGVQLYDQQDAAERLAGVRARPGATAAARRRNAATAYLMAS